MWCIMITEIIDFTMMPYSGVNLHTYPKAIYLDHEIDGSMFICFYPYKIGISDSSHSAFKYG